MKIHTKVEITSTPFLNLNQTYYEDNTGKVKTWSWAQRPNDMKAVVIAATLNGLLVLIKEYRVPIEDYIYELPAGLIDTGEDPYTAGCREFEEETGYRIRGLIRPISPFVVNSPGLSDEAICFLFGKAEDTGKKPEHGASEEIEVMTLSRLAVADLLRDKNVKIGAKAYLVFMHFAEYGVL